MEDICQDEPVSGAGDEGGGQLVQPTPRAKREPQGPAEPVDPGRVRTHASMKKVSR